MKQIAEKRKDIAFYIKLLPLVKIHPKAYKKSKAIACEKSMKMLEDAFQKKALPEPACETDTIDKNMELAQRLGITGTPAVILPDGRVLRGALKADQLMQYVDEAGTQ